MKKGKIGVQMMMVKNEVAENDVYETMRKIAELGYRSVEISQIPMTTENVAEFKRASADFDIEIAAMSAFIEPVAKGLIGDSLKNDFNEIVNNIGMIPLDLMGDKDKTMEFIRKAESEAVKLAEHNIELYHHTHHVEFEKYDGKYLLDIYEG